jgi:hypothetical protein
MPFIKQIAEFVKLINLDKLTGKANKDKVSKTKKKADTMPEAAEDAPSAQPQEQEGGSENSETIKVIKQDATSEPSDTNTESVKETSSSENKTSENKSTEENNSGDNSNNNNSQAQNNTDDSGENNSDTPDSTDGTGAKTESSNLPATNPSKPTEEISVLTKIGTWVKDNPGKSALIVGGLVLAFTAGPSVLGLGKVNTRGKTKKGKKKNNPPKAISGLPKNKKHKKPIPKAGKKHNPKPKYKNKPRGRGNAPKQITL